jgi:hypothetical protein
MMEKSPEPENVLDIRQGTHKGMKTMKNPMAMLMAMGDDMNLH